MGEGQLAAKGVGDALPRAVLKRGKKKREEKVGARVWRSKMIISCVFQPSQPPPSGSKLAQYAQNPKTKISIAPPQLQHILAVHICVVPVCVSFLLLRWLRQCPRRLCAAIPRKQTGERRGVCRALLLLRRLWRLLLGWGLRRIICSLHGRWFSVIIRLLLVLVLVLLLLLPA